MIARNGNRSDSYNLQPLNFHRDETKVAPVRRRYYGGGVHTGLTGDIEHNSNAHERN